MNSGFLFFRSVFFFALTRPNIISTKAPRPTVIRSFNLFSLHLSDICYVLYRMPWHRVVWLPVWFDECTPNPTYRQAFLAGTSSRCVLQVLGRSSCIRLTCLGPPSYVTRYATSMWMYWNIAPFLKWLLPIGPDYMMGLGVSICIIKVSLTVAARSFTSVLRMCYPSNDVYVQVTLTFLRPITHMSCEEHSSVNEMLRHPYMISVCQVSRFF
jgi:hypothetical protein